MGGCFGCIRIFCKIYFFIFLVGKCNKNSKNKMHFIEIWNFYFLLLHEIIGSQTSYYVKLVIISKIPIQYSPICSEI